MKKFLGKYEILQSIGKGGMGEVFLAHDPDCEREVALKVMLPQWKEKPHLRKRFFKEAKIAALLTHPSIIPIHSIDEENTSYTMPYIEGDTLKSILKRTKEQIKKGETLHPIGGSIPSLVRIFLSICSAIAYTHDRGILHRDIKPENVIVGKFGDVLLLDWGLADFKKDIVDDNGVPGTITYMAPERALGHPSNEQVDIYALGVILYFILTLQLPFQRTTLKEYREHMEKEEFIPSEEVAPDRDIAPHLSHITRKCLAKDPSDRYLTVSELIGDLQRYIEGLPEWLPSATLDLSRKDDWGFQENVALAKHMAITKSTDTVEWVNLMISKQPFPGNLKLETEATIGPGGKGIGLLLSAAPVAPQKGFEEGYLLWLGTEASQLYRGAVEVAHYTEVQLEKGKPMKIRLEMIDNHLRLYLNESLKISFLSHIPMPGSHVGLMLRDGDFSLNSGLHVSTGSQNAMVNCLAVPDAFLARKNYEEALSEYRKIARSFPGRQEGREAIFRAGISLLQQAALESKETLFSAALDEFGRLKNTPGAPLEYLGKALVYKEQNELDEEVKCLELALRKYPKHPLKHILVENLLSRLHESAQTNRLATYQFALLALRLLPYIFQKSDEKKLLESLKKNLEPLPFFAPSESAQIDTAIQLAFWLNKPMAIIEMLEKGLATQDRANALSALMQLGHESLAEAFDPHDLGPMTMGGLFRLFEKALREKSDPAAYLAKYPEKNSQISALEIWNHLLHQRFDEAKNLFDALGKNEIESPSHPLFFLYACMLAKTAGPEMALQHLSLASDTPFPPVNSLLSHFLRGQIDFEGKWGKNAFYYEKLQLLRQLKLYTLCVGDHPDLKDVEKKMDDLMSQIQ